MKDREVRYQSAADLRADVRRLRRKSDIGRTLAGSGTTAAATMPARTPWSRRIRLALVVGLPVLLAAGAAAAWLLMWSPGAPALTERDPVVLADFVNRTGDAMFDDTLGEALAMRVHFDQGPT